MWVLSLTRHETSRPPRALGTRHGTGVSDGLTTLSEGVIRIQSHRKNDPVLHTAFPEGACQRSKQGEGLRVAGPDGERGPLDSARGVVAAQGPGSKLWP